MQSYPQSLGYRCGRYLHKHTRLISLQRYFQRHYELQPPGSTSTHYLEDASGHED
jgi:hypothetical protein